MISALSHPNIIEGYEFNWDPEGDLFMVMEALDGLFMGSAYVGTGGGRVWPWVLAGTASLVGSAGLAWVLLFG